MAAAALGVGQVWFTSLNGSVGLGYEDRVTSYGGQDRDSQTYEEGLGLNTEGIIWDYRFFKFKAGISLSNEQTTSDSRSGDRVVTGFRLSSILFPVWRYPYGPIFINASKSQSTTESDNGGSNQVDNTFFQVRWRFFQKLLGRLTTSYSLRLHETTPVSSERQDETQHELTIDAERRFREGQWGSSRVEYGYEFESLEDSIDGTSTLKHDLYARDHTELGDKVDFNAQATLYYSTQDPGNAGGDTLDSSLLTTSAQLQIRQTERFNHYYSLSASRSEFAGKQRTTNTGTAGARYRYRHVFDEYLSGFFTSGGNLRFAQSSEGGAKSAISGNAGGSLRYIRAFGDFKTSSSYSVDVSHTLSSGNDGSDRPRVGQSAYVGYTRDNNRLYQDSARFTARMIYQEELTHSYSLIYRVDSEITKKDVIGGSASAGFSRPGGGNSFGVGASWRRKMSRFGSIITTASSNWRNSNGRDRQSRRIEARYRDRYVYNFPVSVSAFIRQEYEAYTIDEDETRLKAGIDMDYRIGKIVVVFNYDYSVTERDNYEVSDQLFKLSLLRQFGMRL